MGLINPAQISDGTTIDAADVNTPINTIANEFNGNIDDNNVKTSAGIKFSKTSGGSDTALTAWTSYTPSWTSSGTAPALGNGTLTGAYVQIGKTVHFRVNFTAGSTSTFGTGTYSFTLPVTAASGLGTSSAIGSAYLEDAGITGYIGTVFYATTTTVTLRFPDTTNAYKAAALTGTAPFTVGSADFLRFSGTYEAA